jgi:hypothetical protein
MTNKPDKDFGKRRPASVATVPRQGPPAKRSGHVALLLMGTLAVGSTAYTLMPRDNCQRPPDVPSPSLLQSSNTECPPRSSSSSHGGSGGGSSRSSYSSSGSSSGSSSTTSDSGSHAVQRGGFGSFGHAVGFSGS